MSGRHRIIAGELAQGNKRGKALIAALSEMNQDEKGATYHGKGKK